MKTILALAALAAMIAAPAVAADYGKRPTYKSVDEPTMDRGFHGRIPACDDPRVEHRVVNGFSATEREYWNSTLELSPFVAPREIDYRPWGADFIPRRFCEAKVATNDGRKRVVVYSIREKQGFASIGWGVEWCVTGLDRHYSYAPRCMMAAP